MSFLTQLLRCFDDWASSRNKSRPTDVIFLNFSKAFDSVPHERLLLKLKCHGIEGSLLRWFRSFLTDRKQRVVVRGTHLSWSCVTSRSAVLQGTILGPILFLIYVNDISSNISSTLSMFADDIKVYRELSNIGGTVKPYNLMSISYYPGARFSKAPIINGPVKLFGFT